MAKSEFIKTIEERGFLHQATDLESLDQVIAKDGVTAYIGFDLTAKSLHVGSLVQIMLLRWLQKCGHKPIILMGGGTTKIGDPSGRDSQRQLLTPEDIETNKANLQQVFAKYIDFDDPKTGALIVDNAEWLDDLKYIDFLRDIGRHFSINRMLTFDSVKLRLDREQPLSFLEFNYMLLQAYDFTELNRRHGCRLQLGGSDQWGNIVNGIDLARRLGQEELFGLTSPLITTSSGAKMGKTANGAVWLNADMLSPYDYWQFWRNTEDADVIRFLKMFTELPMQQIEDLDKLEGKDINQAKIILADEATALCHGREAAESARETAQKTFAEHAAGDDLPTYEISSSILADGMPAFKFFAEIGICESGGAARRLIQGGGARINNEKVEDPAEIITSDTFAAGEVKFSAGKKKHMLVLLKK
jgi:tyrosyl-tRNA synthetase